MTAPLVPCHACRRHLRADASRCPFCDAARAPQELAYVPVPRMSRAAFVALGAVLTVAPAAALLGGADEADAQPHHSPPRPMYGVPPRPPRPTPDAGAAPDAAAPDAGARDAGAASDGPRRTPPRVRRDEDQPLYGASPKPEE